MQVTWGKDVQVYNLNAEGTNGPFFSFLGYKLHLFVEHIVWCLTSLDKQSHLFALSLA